MKKRKIIHISGPSSALQTLNIPLNSDDYIMWSWAQQVARKTLKHTNKYEIECWRSEPDIKKMITRKIEGVMFKVFPCFRLRGVGEISLSMLKSLKKEERDNEILLHLHHPHSLEFCLLSYLFRDYPIIAQHHGGSSPIIFFTRKKNPFYLFGYYLIEKPTLKYVDHFFAGAKGEMEFLSHIVDPSMVTLQSVGINCEEFKPVDKAEARKKLDLPLDKKIMLYIGRYYKLKGVDAILKAFKQLKGKYDVELILIGGTSNDEFFDDAKSLGARVYGTLPHDTLPLYFNAADVYLLTSFDKNLVLFGGFGISPIESLACGTPIVSSQLIHFPDDKWEKLGKIPKNEDDIVKCVSNIFDDPSPYNNCREVAREYYDRGHIIKKNIDIYDELFKKYYI